MKDPGAAGRRATHSRRAMAVRVLLLGVAVATALAVAAWIQLRSAMNDLADARAAIESAQRLSREGDMAAVLDSLVSAERHLAGARATLHSSTPLHLARAVPGVRQNVDAARALTERAFVLATSARRVADVATPLVDDGLLGEGGAVDTDLLNEIQDETSVVRAQVAELDAVELPSSWMLWGKIEEAGVELTDGERDYLHTVSTIDDAMALVGHMVGADEPRRWLIVAANAAEMRGAGGMILSYVELEADAGTVTLGRVAPEEELHDQLGSAVTVSLPPDFERRYGRYRPTEDIRNATLSADFTIGAPIVEAIYAESTGMEIDGVIQVDSMALASILDVIGPVSVDGIGKVSGGSVVALTLNQLYSDYDENEARQDALAGVAAAVFDRLLATPPDPASLVDAIAQALDGRHMMLYSSTGALQERVERLGVSGSLPSGTNMFHLAVENFSGNKLDYYIDTDLSLRGEWTSDDLGHVTAAITITNDAPNRDEPRYVFGPVNSSMVAGHYRAHGVLYLPAGATLTDTTDFPGFSEVVEGTERGRPVVTFAADVPAGESVTIELALELPETHGCTEITLVPSPRIRPTTAEVEIDGGLGSFTYRGALSDTAVIPGPC